MGINGGGGAHVDEQGGAGDGAPVSAGERRYGEPTDADRVRELLLRAGLSQRGAARELDVDERTMRHWCAGSYPPPKMAFLALEHLVDMRREVKGRG